MNRFQDHLDTSVKTAMLADSPSFRLSLSMTRRIVRRLIEEDIRMRRPQIRVPAPKLASPNDLESFQYSVRMLRRVVRRIIDQAPQQAVA